MNALVPVSARFDPFDAGLTRFDVVPGQTLAEIIAAAPGVPEWFDTYGVAVINGEIVPREMWGRVRPKAGTLERPVLIELKAVPMGGGSGGTTKNILTTVAAIGLIAATGFVGAGGLATLGLGSAFAAGTTGASLAAAGIGIAGQLALTALAPPPPKNKDGDQTLSSAGIAGNALSPMDTLPGILGKMRISPPLIAPPYTTFENGIVTAHAVFGWAGRCLVENILVNGTDAALFTDATLQTREGIPGDARITICDKTVLEVRANTELKNFIAANKTSKKDRLVHQSSPDSDLPQWQNYRTRSACDEIWIRLFWPSGMVKSDTSDVAAMPVRIEMRPVGSSTWLKLPVCHFQDARKGRQMRQQIRLLFRNKDVDGLSYDTEQAAFAAFARTGIGFGYEYAAESCFSLLDIIPVMTAATTAGCTMSASNDNGGANPAWKAGDDDTATYWRNASGGVATLTAQLASAQKVGAYVIYGDSAATNTVPGSWTFEGSNDGVSWTILDTQTTYPWGSGYAGEFSVPLAARGSYSRYRLNMTATDGGSHLRVTEFALRHDGCGAAWALSNAPTGLAGSVNSTDDGFDIYLDPDVFPQGPYEVRIKRGLAFKYSLLSTLWNYYWDGVVNTDNLFDYYLSGGYYIVKYGQIDYPSDCIMEVFSSYSTAYPFADPLPGVGMIAIEAPNLQIQSVSALLTSYAPDYASGVWQTEETPTQNPAALYRKVLLGSQNALALPGEIVDEDNLAAWHQWCAAQGHECNAIAQGLSVEQVLQLVASSGWAVPKQSALWGVIYERDRSGDGIVQLFTPRNSRSAGISIDYPRPAHAIRAEYYDETDDYQVTDDVIYADGYSAENATEISAMQYDGFTAAAKVAARATLDLRQLRYRQSKDVREVAFESLVSQRGDLVGVNDDVIEVWHGSTIVSRVITSGGDITGLVLEAVIDLSLAQNEATAIADVTAVADVTATPAAMGIAIRGDTGAIVTKAIVETAATNTVTFSAPFADPGDIVPGCLVALGVLGQEFARKIIFSIEPGDDLTARITLVDEAPEIHA